MKVTQIDTKKKLTRT